MTQDKNRWRKYYLKRRKDGYWKKYRAKNREKLNLKIKEWRQKNKDKDREYHRKYRNEHKEYYRQYHNKNYHLKRVKYYQNRNFKLRMIVLNHYSNNNPKCVCCGEKEYKFLGMDHINGGGNIHRKKIGFRSMTGWLIKNNFPTGFQILCHNCNCAKGYYGECPHKLK